MKYMFSWPVPVDPILPLWTHGGILTDCVETALSTQLASGEDSMPFSYCYD